MIYVMIIQQLNYLKSFTSVRDTPYVARQSQRSCKPGEHFKAR